MAFQHASLSKCNEAEYGEHKPTCLDRTQFYEICVIGKKKILSPPKQYDVLKTILKKKKSDLQRQLKLLLFAFKWRAFAAFISKHYV